MLAPVSGLNAGMITIAGMGMPPSESPSFGLTVDAGGPSFYNSPTGDTQFFSGGDTVSVQAPAGPISPAFAPQMPIAPSIAVVTTPGCGNQRPPSIGRRTCWCSGQAADLQGVVSFEVDSDTQTVLLQCNFDATAGTGMVPSALLSKLDPGGSGVLQITAINQVALLNGSVKTSSRLFDLYEALPTFSN